MKLGAYFATGNKKVRLWLGGWAVVRLGNIFWDRGSYLLGVAAPYIHFGVKAFFSYTSVMLLPSHR